MGGRMMREQKGCTERCEATGLTERGGSVYYRRVQQLAGRKQEEEERGERAGDDSKADPSSVSYLSLPVPPQLAPC